MRIAVFGVGAVGGYFGGCLAQTQHEVAFIARGQHLAAIQADGLRVASTQGDFVARPALATHDPAEIGPVDMVILATKAWQVEAAAHAMQPLIAPHTVVLPLLNGVEAPFTLAEIIGAAHVLGGFCRVLSHIAAPGQVTQGGVPPFVAFGEMDGTPSERVGQIKAVFDEAGVTVQLPHSIQAAMWEKLLFIASFGGVGAVTRMPAGVIRNQAETRHLLENAMAEVYEVAYARGVPLPDEAVERGMGLVDALPEDATASMQRDLMQGHPSELEAQNGAVLRLGAAAGVQAPTHRFIYHALLPTERQARRAAGLPG